VIERGWALGLADTKFALREAMSDGSASITLALNPSVISLPVFVHESWPRSLPPGLSVPRPNNLTMNCTAHAVMLLDIELGQLVVLNDAGVGQVPK